jgi:putative ABC transport system permease protein
VFPFRLVLRNLTRHRLRLALTTASLAVAVFVLILLRSLVVALEAGVAAAASDRLIVQSAVSLFVNLPIGYEARIRQVEGVGELTKFQWFGGVYRERGGFFAQFGVDPEAFLASYPEVRIVEGSREDFLRSRESALVGVELAQRYGWKVGDTVPLEGTIYRRSQGDPWRFRIAGLYESTRANVDQGTLYFHFELLDQALRQGAAEGPPGVGVYVLRVAPGNDLQRVMADVDALFENGPQRVQTTTEAEFQQQFVSMIGDVPFFLGSLGGGILLAILLAALNTMLMAAREQARDVGVLKSLGFSDALVGGVLLTQSLLVCGLGGGLGVVLAVATEDGMIRALGSMFPGYSITGGTVALGLALSLGLGLAAGLLPAWRAARTRVVETLRMEI